MGAVAREIDAHCASAKCAECNCVHNGSESDSEEEVSSISSASTETRIDQKDKAQMDKLKSHEADLAKRGSFSWYSIQFNILPHILKEVVNNFFVCI